MRRVWRVRGVARGAGGCAWGGSACAALRRVRGSCSRGFGGQRKAAGRGERLHALADDATVRAGDGNVEKAVAAVGRATAGAHHASEPGASLH
eukprot:6315688-Prymnesium_polylepis.1